MDSGLVLVGGYNQQQPVVQILLADAKALEGLLRPVFNGEVACSRHNCHHNLGRGFVHESSQPGVYLVYGGVGKLMFGVIDKAGNFGRYLSCNLLFFAAARKAGYANDYGYDCKAKPQRHLKHILQLNFLILLALLSH